MAVGPSMTSAGAADMLATATGGALRTGGTAVAATVIGGMIGTVVITADLVAHRTVDPMVPMVLAAPMGPAAPMGLAVRMGPAARTAPVALGGLEVPAARGIRVALVGLEDPGLRRGVR